MQSGKVLSATSNGVYILKLEGDVRLNLSTAFDQFIENMFLAGDYRSALIDLTEAVGIDSTMLGLLAKISIMAQHRSLVKPTIVSSNDDISKILDSMGFEQVFYIVDHVLSQSDELNELPAPELHEEAVRCKVLEAHKTLMSLNESNRQAFQVLVDSLEQESNHP